MRIIDISMRIEPGMATFGMRPENDPRHRVLTRFDECGVNESEIAVNLHAGTHLDAPFHMLEGGAPTELLPLERLIAPCRVLDVTRAEGMITRDDLLPHGIQAGEFILFKTKNSARGAWYPGFVSLGADAARHLAQLRVSGVGIDALGVERDQPGHETHRALLGAGVIILEGLRLEHVEPGCYTLIALPVRIRDADGAPCRAVLVEGDLTPGGPLPETRRLRFRRWRNDDADALFALAGDPRVGPAAGFPAHRDVQESRRVIRDILSRPYTFALELKETGELAGNISLRLYAGGEELLAPGEGEIGFWLGHPYWGRGLMTEALTALLAFAFERQRCTSVWCGYYEGNARSRRVQEKCGFTHHHTDAEKPTPLGPRRTLVQRLTRGEWARITASDPAL